MSLQLRVPSYRILSLWGVGVATLLIGGTLAGIGPMGHGKTDLTLQFSEVAGLYVGDTVSVLDVPVGEVTSIEPHPGHVDVGVAVDDEVPLPADAKAVIVAPSLVSIRHIDLTPYSGGPKLESNATIPVSRTASPVEWDRIKEQLSRLTEALGPRGANKDGSLNSLLRVSAKNLDGRGGDIHATMEALSTALATLSESGGDLFGTVRNLHVLTTALDESEDEIIGFNERFANVSQSLDTDKDDLVKALDALAALFPELQKFLKDNGDALIQAVSKLRGPAKYIADERQNVADILQVAPGALSNFYNIMDPDIPGPTGTFALVNFSNVAEVICAMSYSMGGTPDQCRNLLEPIAKYLNLGAPPAGLIPILRDGRNNVEPPPGSASTSRVATPAAAASESGQGSRSLVPPIAPQVDPLLGGLDSLMSGLAGGSR